jgi:GH15 family glucan-1,4-alpha-glucosidase
LSAHREPLVHVDPATAWELITEDEARWQAWSAQIDDHLPCRDTAVRNWDYRYAWPRDASIGVAAFLRVGKLDEARGFLGWLSHASRLQRPRLPSLLTLDGRHVPP